MFFGKRLSRSGNVHKKTTHKQFIHVTGYLAGILKPGAPATYLYHFTFHYVSYYANFAKKLH